MRVLQRLAFFWQRCNNHTRTRSKANIMNQPKENNTMNQHEEDPQRAREANENWPESARQESKLLRSPEHQKNVRQPMNYVKRSMLVCMLAIVLTTLLTAGVAQAAGLTGPTWSLVPSPNVGSYYNDLYGVAAVAANDIWAVGSHTNIHRGERTLIEHWNGTSWQVVSSPNPGSDSNVLQGVAVVSASDIWAVGSYQNYSNGNYGPQQTLIEHWDGSSWQVVPSPNHAGLGNLLDSVAQVPGGTSLWAVGYRATSGTHYHRTLTEFYG